MSFRLERISGKLAGCAGNLLYSLKSKTTSQYDINRRVVPGFILVFSLINV